MSSSEDVYDDDYEDDDEYSQDYEEETGDLAVSSYIKYVAFPFFSS